MKTLYNNTDLDLIKGEFDPRQTREVSDEEGERLLKLYPKDLVERKVVINDKKPSRRRR